MQKYNKGVPHRDIPLFLFGNSIAAEGFSFALGTSQTVPNAINRSAIELARVGSSVGNLTLINPSNQPSQSIDHHSMFQYVCIAFLVRVVLSHLFKQINNS